jgi:hypothetical protein
MANIQSAGTGVFGTGATWVGGVAPGVSDTYEIMDGHVVTINANATVASGAIRGSGRLVYGTEDVSLTHTSPIDFLVDGHASDSSSRIHLIAGCKFLATPGSGNQFNFKLGTGLYPFARIEAVGTEAKPCRIGLADGAAGSFTISNQAGQTHNQGFIIAEWTHFELGGPETAGGDCVNMTTRFEADFRLTDCVVSQLGRFYYSPFNTRNAGADADTTFTRVHWYRRDSVGENLLHIEAYYGPVDVQMTNCRFGGNITVNFVDGGPSGLWARTGNIYEGTVGGNWDASLSADNGSVVYQTVGTSGTLIGGGVWDKTYFVSLASNPHCFIGGGKAITKAVFDEANAWGGDTGDSYDFSGTDSSISGSFILPNAKTANKTSGTIWWLNGPGQLRLFHNTIFCPESLTGLSYSHSAAMAADRVPEIKSNLFYGNGAGYGIFNETPADTAVDALSPGGILNNAFIGLSDGTCVIGGVNTTVNGMQASKFSVAPAAQTVLATGGAQFFDPTRNCLKWCLDVRGFTGTDAEVVADGMDYLFANPAKIDDMYTWVTNGHYVQNATLQNAGHDAVTIGAGGFGTPTDPVEVVPLPWTEWPQSYTDYIAKIQISDVGPGHADSMVSEWNLWNSGGGDDNTFVVTYYDATKVWLMIEKRFKTINPTLSAKASDAALAAAKLYHRSYVVPGGGAVAGFWNFTTGLKQLYWKTGDVEWKNAAILLSTNAAYASDAVSDSALVDRVREVAYAVISHLDAEELGEAHRASTDQKIGFMKGHAAILIARTEVVQAFMVAIMIEAFWRVYKWNADPVEREEIVGIISDLCDVMMDRWEPENGWFYYGVDDSRDLNLLIAPAFAIAWHKTGFTRHRDRFDMVYGHGVDGGWVGGPHKQFNQQNKWTDEGEYYRTASTYTALDDVFPVEGPEEPEPPSPNQPATFIPGDAVAFVGGGGLGDRILIIPWDGKK